MKNRIISIIAFLGLSMSLNAQIDTCLTVSEITSLYQSKQQLLKDLDRLQRIDVVQQKMIAEYKQQHYQDSVTIQLYLQTQDELLRLNEHYKNGLKSATRDEKWYQTRFVAYLGGMTAALVGAVGIRLASK